MRWHPWRRPKLPPTHPVYADDRWLGMTWQTRVRIFVVALFATIVMIVIYVTGRAALNDARHDQANRDRQAQAAAIAANSANTQAQIRDLACSLVVLAPPGNPTGDRVRAEYGCPAFGSTVTPSVPRDVLPTTAPGHTLPGAPAPPSHAAATSQQHSPTTHAAAPSSAPRPTPTPPAVTAPVGALGGLVCSVLPFVCVTNTS